MKTHRRAALWIGVGIALLACAGTVALWHRSPGGAAGLLRLLPAPADGLVLLDWTRLRDNEKLLEAVDKLLVHFPRAKAMVEKSKVDLRRLDRFAFTFRIREGRGGAMTYLLLVQGTFD